ncbi:MAG: helix-turn-helix domain-containing protein [Anaerovoracaceae bacterium]
MKKLRVLLVDDEIIIREWFKRLFDWEAHGCEVVGEAADGMEALAQIDALKPDIVIMDINIPIMNGLKVIQVSRMKHPQIAYVIVSGYDDFSYCQQAHLAEDMSLSVLAEEFHLNPQYISQLFKNEIGVGFLAYLTNIRMEKAKKLLMSTSLSLGEISEKSGYGDYRVFTKVFKKSEGITPSQFRRGFLEEHESRI